MQVSNTVSNTVSNVDNVVIIVNVNSITSVFVDCVRRYLKVCFSKELRLNFNKAVKVSIDAVHAICSSQLIKAGNVF